MSHIHNAIAALSAAVDLVAQILSYWRFILIVWLIFGHIQPHMRWSDDYAVIIGEREPVICEYLGLYGRVQTDYETCPAIRLLRVDPWWSV